MRKMCCHREIGTVHWNLTGISRESHVTHENDVTGASFERAGGPSPPQGKRKKKKRKEKKKKKEKKRTKRKKRKKERREL